MYNNAYNISYLFNDQRPNQIIVISAEEIFP